MNANRLINLPRQIRRQISSQRKPHLVLTSLLGLVVVISPIAFFGTRPTANACHGKVAEERLFCEVNPAVVKVEAGDSAGSGVIVSEDGLMLTNAHVVQDATDVKVSFPDTQTGGDVYVSGKVIAYGENGLDLVAVQLTGTGFDYVSLLADSASVGQRVYAIGTPFNQFRNTLTAGIISQVNLEKDLIQTDASINPGNSGGPLLNGDGELIGINTAIYSRDGRGNIGIGFAIAAEKVQEFLRAVENGTAPTEPQIAKLEPGIYQEPQILTMNGVFVAGELTNESNVLEDQSFFNMYQFEGRAGQQVELVMQSTDVDSYLILFNSEGEKLAEDDDSLENGNAHIILTLPANGVYTIFANTYEAGEVGHYQIGGVLTNTDQNAS